MTNTIVDLDSFTCSSDPIEAIGFLADKEKVTFKISSNNPYFNDIKGRYNIRIKKIEGEIIYFGINLDG
ncbi:hypothetical protein BFU36_10725 [Sulfolobus sp. A20]|uniref:hypothetical protein n=1 Tax=Sulfolobaceae TaxID=118883 RepID=UPI000845FDDF|nr:MULTISPECIES: hypothetical protein [unclassified Sulfolobus]TRM77652.1 hypothetical protein DJ528_06260 [Sulfolobus sp. B5]TRM78419.1 hypothetical protein DJ532_01295 [Sulfolobus sp. A20-N-F8]TRM80745.1 hypothetical protein DJ531_11880 [Sulfolobus sp. A20-N-F6]TRM82124.1 hypothetical protein DJ524_01760 [Sulfolobus sp. D5]TRM87608.1 hypothetical protein DJ521_03310 [Sulfolobus sp. E3]TRM89174.1 hypothetical protein DJ529_02930 [Sulfolobus sp. C3]TRM99967.1 hypothetical protein DJ530_08130